MKQAFFTLLAVFVFFTPFVSYAEEDAEDFPKAAQHAFEFAKIITDKAFTNRPDMKDAFFVQLDRERQELIALEPTIKVKSVQEAIRQAMREGARAKKALINAQSSDTPFRSGPAERRARMREIVRGFQTAQILAYKAAMIPADPLTFKKALKKGYTVNYAIQVSVPMFMGAYSLFQALPTSLALPALAAYYAVAMPFRAYVDHVFSQVQVGDYQPRSDVIDAFMSAAGAPQKGKDHTRWLRNRIQEIAGEQLCEIWLGGDTIAPRTIL